MAKQKSQRQSRRGGGRIARTVRTLVYISALGAVLAVYNVVSTSRDIATATGPAGKAQEQFFVDAASRPDLQQFFKRLTPAQRLQMSQNIGKYDDPELAQLVGKCLDTFDVPARRALTKSLAHIASAQPKSVAEQLKLPGSFQQLAVMTALKSAGNRAIPLVAQQLLVAEARTNAVSYLVAAGTPAIPVVLGYLDSDDKDVKLAAADALGKLRAERAVPKLTELFKSVPPEQKPGYLTALSGIGSPSSEELLSGVLDDEQVPLQNRAQASLGLGRIATPSAVALLWRYAADERLVLRQTAVSALQLAGDAALTHAQASEELLLEVAAGIRTPLGDQIVRRDLHNPDLVKSAAKASQNRATLVSDLMSVLASTDPDAQGDVADSLIQALLSSSGGTGALASLKDPRLDGLVRRRKELASLQGQAAG